MTKDERLLFEIYTEAAGNTGTVVNPQLIARKLGYKEVLLREIIKGLCKANFIKAYSLEEVVITVNGIALAKTLAKG